MIHYFNPKKEDSLLHFANTLKVLVQSSHHTYKEIVLLCIGSDRATGDSLGPLIGHRFMQSAAEDLDSGAQKNFHIYGTLEYPVHAKNLEATLQHIQFFHDNPFVIAIDASLGVMEHIGYVTLGTGCLLPGIGVDKKLPAVGDIFITGIVNLSGFGSQQLLQTTHLHLVFQLADFIYQGLREVIPQLQLCPALQCAE